MRRAFPFTVLYLLALLTYQPHLLAQDADTQKYSFEFSGVELYEALKVIANSTDADIVFDPAITDDVYIYERIQDKTVGKVLSIVLEGSELDYIVLSSGTYVIINSSKQDPEYATFAGKIFDDQTGEALPGATIMLANTGGGTTSNQNGYFSLGKLKTGSYDIIFSYTGYQPVKKTVVVSPETDQPAEVTLHSKRVDFSPLVVYAHQPLIPITPNNKLSGQIQSEWSAGQVSHDAIRALSLFSGVQYGLPMADIHLQGGRSGDHRMFLDGVPVYNPYSFGQLYSAFSPYALGRISVTKSGFDASEGSYISGKIDLNHNVNTGKGELGIVQADPMSANARFGVSSQNTAFRLMGAVRSSFWDWFQYPALSKTVQDWDFVDPLTYNILVAANGDMPVLQSASNRADIRYHDIHLAGTYDINDYHDLSFSIYQGDNFVKTDMLTAGTMGTEEHRMFATDTYDWDNLISQIQYNWIASLRLDVVAKLSYSTNRLHHQYAMFDATRIAQFTGDSAGSADQELRLLSARIDEAGKQNDRNNIRHITFSSDFQYSFNPHFSLSGGLQIDHLESLFDLKGLFYLPSVNDQSSFILANYIDAEWGITPNLKLTGGSRFTTFGSGRKIYAEPRSAIQYDRSNTSIGYWSLKISGGVYRQFINNFDITNVGPSSLVPSFSIWSHNDNLDQPVSYNASMDFWVEPAEGTTFTLEGYVKKQPSTYMTSYDNLLLDNESDRTGFKSFAAPTDMYAYGAGIRYHQALINSDLQLLLGYDLSVSRVNYDAQFGRVLPAHWNEPHRIQARILGRLVPGFSVVAKWQSIIGRKWGFRKAYYDFLVPHNFNTAGNYDFLTPDDDSIKPFHQLDLAFVYQLSGNLLDAEIRLNFINLLDRQNALDQYLVPVREEANSANDISNREFDVRKRKMPGFTPSLSVKLGF